MSGTANGHPPPGKRSPLSREITLALLVKLALLSGLWFFFFQGDPKESTAKPDIEALFAPAQKAAASTHP